MIIRKIYIENFGKLSRFEYELTDGVNRIVSENGWGKSTMAAFIRVMFYGFDGEKKRDASANERKKYAPWQGGTYGGCIYFCQGGREYMIRRTFGSKKSEDTFECRDATTNLVCTAFSDNIGEEIFEVNSESFGRTVFIGQNSVITGATDGINAKISNLAGNAGDIDSYEKAMLLLKKAINQRSPSRATGSIKKLKDEIVLIKAQLRDESASMAEAGELRDKASRKQKELAELVNRRAKADEDMKSIEQDDSVRQVRQEYAVIMKECAVAADNMERVRRSFSGTVPDKRSIGELITRSARLDEMKEEIDQRRSKIDEAGSDCKKPSVLPRVLMYILAIAAALALIYVTYKNPARAPYLAICLLTEACCFAADIVLCHRRRRRGEINRQNAREELRKIERSAGRLQDELYRAVKRLGVSMHRDLTGQLYSLQESTDEYYFMQREYERRLKERQEFEKKHQDILAKASSGTSEGISLGSTRELLNQLTDSIDRVKDEIRDIDKLVDNNERKLEMLQSSHSELEVLEQTYDDELKDYGYLEKASEYLTRAKESLTSRYINPLSRGFDRYMSMLEESEEYSYHIDAGINVYREEYNGWRELDSLSAGYQDLVSFCLRLAMIGAMYDEEHPMLILDDPFVNLDDRKFHMAMDMLEELAGEYQVLYFSCRSYAG